MTQLQLALVCMITLNCEKEPPYCIDCSKGVLILGLEYDLLYQGNKVGIVRLDKSGLFYFLKCKFQVDETRPLHLLCKEDNKETDLGLCGKYGASGGIKRRIPVKMLGEGKLRFILSDPKPNLRFIPVNSDCSFPHLDKLLQAKFTVQEGIKGILLDR